MALLADQGLVGEELEIVALSRDDYTEDQYRQLVGRGLAEVAPSISRRRGEWLTRRLRYSRLDLTDPAAGQRLADALRPGPVLCYLALPPSLLAAAVGALGDGALPRETTLVIEKPFGEDTDSARSLNRDLHALLPPDRVLRADHFLHHQVVQDVLALRMGGGVLDRLWDREHVEAVEIVWEEAGAVAGRAELFDRLGSVRDMVQSHLLQLLAMVAMEAPAAWDETAVRAARLAVLRAVRTPGAVVTDWVARGRYTAGEVAAGPVVGYADEPGVDPDRGTETYVSLRLDLDLDRWRGVPFVLRTGKAVGSPRRFVSLRLHDGERTGVDYRPTVIRIEMDPASHPARVDLGLGATGPGGLPQVSPAALTSAGAPADLPATGRLLRDALAGRPALFPGAEEVEECWRITDAVLAAVDGDHGSLQEYPAGSAGPPASF